MTAALTIDNIDRLRTNDLDPPRGWEVVFRSLNAGMHHQLYVNGRLADWTDTPEQRRFLLAGAHAPREICVAAVAAEDRAADLSDQLPEGVRNTGWVYRASVVRFIGHAAADRVALHTDHATGELDPEPLVVREIWPAWAPRWAWGESAFGLGGFGYGGVGAPGLGKGAFGAASFGMDADLIHLAAELAEDGTHTLVLRTLASDGRFADAEAEQVAAHPPPTPPAALEVAGYDPQTHTLTLEIKES